MVDILLLKQSIANSGKKVVAIAEKSGILRETLYNRLNGVGEFTATEIDGLTRAIPLTKEERDNIFFAEQVE